MLNQYIQNTIASLNEVPAERKAVLQPLIDWLRQRADQPTPLIFICTHNARRSHLSEVWAAVAAHHYGFKNVQTFSGGVEVTQLHPNAAAALRRAGVSVVANDNNSQNPHYTAVFAQDAPAKTLFSKEYDAPFNPQKDFAAVLVCSAAEEACPMIRTADLRVLVSYEDPKKADGTPQEAAEYDARSRQIAQEMFYVFSQVKPYNTKITNIIAEYEKVFSGDPLYGKSLLAILENVPADKINYQLSAGNSIAQIAEHILIWRIFTLEKMRGNQTYRIEINSEADWQKNRQYSPADWADLIQRIKDNQKAILAELATKNDAWLDTHLGNSPHPYSRLLESTLQHDIYHIGQIALLVKS